MTSTKEKQPIRLMPPTVKSRDVIGDEEPSTQRERNVPRNISPQRLSQRARNLMYQKLELLAPKDLAAIVVADLKWEEAKLRAVGAKGGGPSAGLQDLKQKMRSAVSGGRAAVVDGEGDDDADEEETLGEEDGS